MGARGQLCYHIPPSLQIGSTMGRFEELFQDLDVHTQVMDSSMDTAMTLSTPHDQVEGLMKQVLVT